MASIKDLKTRITSVKNTQQTTKAMKMVSASKLRRAQEAILSQRPYARKIQSLLERLSRLPESPITSPLFRREEESTENSGRKVLLIAVTSDRGLSGAFNGNVIKAVQRWLVAHQGEYVSIELGFVGKKAYDFFKTKSVNMGFYQAELGGKVTFSKASKVAQLALEAYESGRVDEVKFVYNEFKNAVTQKVVVENFLPLAQALSSEPSVDSGVPEAEPLVIVKPSPSEIIEALLRKNFAIQTFRIMLESQAGEHGARMSAMENATKNAGEMIRKLSLQYNKQRQASITKELLEIISGSESQKG